MKFTGDDFCIVFHNSENKVVFSGSMRLWDAAEYAKINRFLLDIYELNLPHMVLDFQNLEFLNSAGIGMLCKFVLLVKGMNKMPVSILGNKSVLWQVKSFSNLRLLWKDIGINFK